VGSLRRACSRSSRRSLSTSVESARRRDWSVLERRASAAVLHGVVPDPLGRRLACGCLPTGPAVVMGSAQAASDFDASLLAAQGLELVRRRSGGGAVLVAPGCQVWLDVFVPKGDVLAQPDVGESFHWLGQAYADAIAAVLGMSRTKALVEVNLGPVRTTPWSKVLCYAGLGAGEVTVAGRKVVGMSQRRERTGAWFHTMAILGEKAGDLGGVLSGSEQRRSQARAVLAATGLGQAERLVAPLSREILSRLP